VPGHLRLPAGRGLGHCSSEHDRPGRAPPNLGPMMEAARSGLGSQKRVHTSRKLAFGLDPLVPASIWAGTKGPATSPQNGLAAREVLVPARYEPLVPV
jgi:hypothetical protein